MPYSGGRVTRRDTNTLLPQVVAKLMEMVRESICKCRAVAGKPGLTGTCEPPLSVSGEEGLAEMALVSGRDLPSCQVG